MPLRAPPLDDTLLRAALRALRGPARLRVRLGGTSMTPLLRDGTWAEVGPPPVRPRRGMVLICARPGGPLLIHRVIGVRATPAGGLVCTKGDALAHHDGWWAPDEVLGQVLRVASGARWVALDRGWRAGLGWLVAGLSPLGIPLTPPIRRLRAALRPLWRRLTRLDPQDAIKRRRTG